MKVSYLVVNGVILSETRSGVESDYIPDPIGSTVALMNTSGVNTDTFTYWPYGELRSHIGSSISSLRYGGTLGYYTDSESGWMYVRARIYDPVLTHWQTVDPFWPYQWSYIYADSSPTVNVDPSGLQVCMGPYVYAPHKARNWPPYIGAPSPPKKKKKKYSTCNNGVPSCNSMCSSLNSNWKTSGVPGGFGADCAMCCNATVPAFPDGPLKDCLAACLIMSSHNFPPPPIDPPLPCPCH